MLRLTIRSLLFGLLIALSARVAWGSVVTVNPARVHLSAAKRSETIEVTNRSSSAARFQLQGYTWTQRDDGSMKLGPTQDLVYFPSLVDLKPGETRRVRVACTVPAGSSERSYRLFIEELPDGVVPAGEIRVLTRMGLPVFVQPATARPRPEVSGTARAKRLRVTLRNAGNAYLMAQTVRVVARGRAGQVLLERSLPGWYVLAGGQRVYDLDLSAAECAELAVVSVTAFTASGRVSRDVRVEGGVACK